MFLDEAIDPGLLAHMVEGGYINITQHPEFPLRIYNYSDKAAFDRVWNEATRNCRGLIVSNENDLIVARGMPKFFNYGEADSDDFDDDEPVIITDKVDGSLGIAYMYEGHWYIATRGSFMSEQAIEATKMIQYVALISRGVDGWMTGINMDETAVFEIIYPENRIVVDYHGERSLRMLGFVHNGTGALRRPNESEWSPQVDVLSSDKKYWEALSPVDRENCEGIVISSLDGLRHQKVKQQDYIRLHRILTGWTKRSIWEQLAIVDCHDVQTPAKLTARMLRLPVEAVQSEYDVIDSTGAPSIDAQFAVCPEEFQEWVTDCADSMYTEYHEIFSEAWNIYTQVSQMERKDAAECIKDEKHKDIVFLLMDDRAVNPAIWSKIRPAHERPFRKVNDEYAV